MGSGFSEDKEKLLNNVLSVRSVFGFGLRIIADVKQHFVAGRGNLEPSQAPDILLRNVENLAILIHDQYNALIEKQYQEKIENGEEIDMSEMMGMMPEGFMDGEDFDDSEDGGATKKSPLSFLSNMFGGNNPSSKPTEGQAADKSSKKDSKKDVS